MVRTEDRPTAVLDIGNNEIDNLRDTVTHLVLRQTITDRPAAAGNATSVHSVFGRSAGGTVLELDPPSSLPRRWNYLGAGGATASVTAVAGQGLWRDVFMRDIDHTLQQARMPAGRFNGWISHGGTLTSEPRPAAEQSGRVLVFARGADFGLQVIDVTAGVPGPWTDLGGVLTSAPAPVSHAPGRYAVAARGLDRGLWYRTWDGATWTAWKTLKGVLATGPAVASTGAGRIDIAALDDAGRLIHRKHTRHGME